MRNVASIARTELKGLCASPMPIAAGGLFALFSGYFFNVLLTYTTRQTLQLAQAGAPATSLQQGLVRPLVENITIALLFMIPVVTMHASATRPGDPRISDSSITDIVVGRFLGMLMFYAGAIGLLWIDIAALSFYTSLEWRPIVMACLGLLLLGASLLAVGYAVASVTTKPVVAGTATFAVFLAMWLVGDLPRVSSEIPNGLATSLSVSDHFNDFARGVLDTRHVIFYLSLIAIGLTVALAVRRADRATGDSRWRVGASAVFAGLVAAVAVNYIAAQQHVRWDLTADRLFSLSDRSLDVLARLESPLRMTVFAQDLDFPRYKDRLEAYEYSSTHLSVSYVNPEQDPAAAKANGVQSFGTIVLGYQGRTGQVVSDTEQAITNAIIKIVDDGPHTIYFTRGHGEKNPASTERDGYSSAVEVLTREQYRVDALELGDRPIPSDAALVVVAGPSVDVRSSDVGTLSAYLDSGGRVMLELDPPATANSPPLTNLVALAQDWGVHVAENLVIDTSGMGALFGADASVTVATSYPPHAITEGFTLPTAFPLAREAAPITGGVGGRTAQPLLESNEKSFAESNVRGALTTGSVAFDEDQGDKSGPITIGSVTARRAAIGNTPREARLVVLGDSDFASNAFIGANGNRDLFVNTIAWLSTQYDPVSIAPRPVSGNGLQLTATQLGTLRWLALLGVPGIVLVGFFFVRVSSTTANAPLAGFPGVLSGVSKGMAMSKVSHQTTRLLCASVLFNHGNARNTVIAWLEDPNRAVASELGIDLRLVAQVARYAERRDRRYWLLYCGIFIVTALFALATLSGGGPTAATVAAVLLGLVVTTVAAMRKAIEDKNTFLPMFVSGRFSPEETAQRFGGDLQAAELSALPSEQQNFFAYAGFMPFVGAGHDLGGWSVAIALDKAKEYVGVPASLRPFETSEIYEAIDRDVQRLGFENLTAKDCYFANGADLREDGALLPDRFGRPVQFLAADTAKRYAHSDSERVRSYRQYQIVDWGGELALSYYLRCLLRGNTLFVETKRFILTPLATQYRAVDESVPLDFMQQLGMFVLCAVSSPFLLIAAPFFVYADLAHRWQTFWGVAAKARKKLIEKNPLFNYGLQQSLRQMLGSDQYGHYFQKMDGDLFNKALEREVLDSLMVFLDEHGVDTSDLKERQTTILNSGVIVHGGDVRADSLAVGTGSQARTEVKASRKKAKGGTGAAS